MTATPSTNSSGNNSPLRRSSRARRQAHTVYDDAAQALRSTPTEQTRRRSPSSSRKSKRRDDDESDDNEVMEKESQEESPSSASENESSPDSSDDDDEEEPYRGTTRSSPRPPLKRKIAIRTTTKDKSSSRSNKGPSKPSSTAAAWKSLFTNVLEEEETPENSYLAALAQVGIKQSRGGKRGMKTSNKSQGAAASLDELTRRIIRQHFANPNAVHVRLYNFLFRICGGQVTALLSEDEVDLENLSDEELTDYITQVVQSMEGTALADVLWTAAPPTAVAKLQFRTLCQEFWYGLGVAALETTASAAAAAKKGGNNSSDSDKDDDDDDDDNEDGAQSSPRFQVEVVRSLVTRLVEMAFLQQEDLRSAVTQALYSLATAVLQKTVDLREKLKTAQRQYQSAKRHKQRRKSEALQIQVDTSKRMLSDLEDIIKESVVAVFMKRYRDVNPHIRASSMLALADFCVIRPDIFFDKKYLKYPGWTLNDKEAVVREAALVTFLRPCQANVHVESVMEGVVEKFSKRLADCTIDVDTNVQERAMELLLLLSRSGLLDSVQDENTWNQINLRALDPDTTPAVRTFALLFIIEQLGAFDEDVADTETNVVERINQLAAWVSHNLGTGEIPLDRMRFDLAGYIVQSLRMCPAHEPLVRNFGALVKSLEDSLDVNVSHGGSQKAQRERTLADAKQRILLEFLMTSVEEEVQLSSPEQVVDVDLREPESKKRKKVSVQEDMTLALLSTLPKLVQSFKSETPLLRRLAKLPLYFSPITCSQSDQKRNYKKILATWSDCFMESSDEIVLQNCCHTLSFLATADHARHDEAMTKLHDILAALRKRLDELIAQKEEINARADESDSDQMDVDGEETSSENVDHLISVVVRRIATLSKRWPLADLLDERDEDEEEVADKLCDQIFQLVTKELDVRKPITEEEEKLEIPGIWKKPNNTHKYVAETVKAALDILLSNAAWAMRKKVAELDSLPSKLSAEAESDEPNVLVIKRQRVDTVLSLCFEQYLDEENIVSEDHRAFSEAVQEAAGRTAGDLRGLFPRAMVNSVHAVLREAALVDDSHLIGGHARFVKSHENKLRNEEGTENPDPWIARKLLVPIARGLCVNWDTGNRREAGLALSHITNSGSEASTIVAAVSKTLKKINPVRLLEAHMACLRQDFEAWAENEPEEPEGDNITDEQNAAFEEAEKKHEEDFQALEHQTQRLSASLGVGKITDSALANGLLGFIREGIRFAFSRDEPGSTVPLFLGARLPFLRLLAKYLVWVRRANRQISIIRAEFNQKEYELRAHSDYENVLESDIEAMSLFRKAGNLGAYVVEDDTTVGGHSMAASSRASSRTGSIFRRRQSQGGHSAGASVSSVPSKVSTNRSDLSPLPEEKDGETEDDYPEVDTGSPGGNSSLGSSSRMFSPESRGGLSTQGSYEQKV